MIDPLLSDAQASDASAPSTHADGDAHSRIRETRRWHSIPVVGLTLILLWPLGLVLLVRRRSRRRWTKIAGAMVTLPLFVVLCLIALKDYWEFGGGMTLSSFRLDFSRGSAQDQRVEAHREMQRSKASGSSGASASGDARISEMPGTLSWPGFRGERRDGIVRDGIAISTDWTGNPPIELWRQPVGEGYSSFVIGHGLLYTIEQRRGRESVVCYDAVTGLERWKHDYPAHFREALGGDGPRATPTLDGDRLYSLGAEGELVCLDALTGRQVWARNILREFGAENLQWGMSASPLVVDDRVIITNSGVGGGSIMAYRTSDGERQWQRDVGQQAYSSPVYATLLGRPMVLNLAAFHLNGLDAATGEVLFSFPWRTGLGISCSQPLAVDDSRVFISVGYGVGSAMVRLGESGGRIEASAAWTSLRMKNKFTSSVIHGGAIYGLDETILACLDLDTGELRWKGGRYGYGSVLLAGDHLIVSGEYGELALVDATPAEHREIGRIQILEGKTWNNPAMAGGLLFARNHKEMVCYDLRGRDTESFRSDAPTGRPASQPQ